MTTARPETEGSITFFFNDILEQFNGREPHKGNAVEVIRTLMLRRGFVISKKPSLLVVDESQGLQSNVLKTLRGLYNEGDLARSDKLLRLHLVSCS